MKTNPTLIKLLSDRITQQFRDDDTRIKKELNHIVVDYTKRGFGSSGVMNKAINECLENCMCESIGFVFNIIRTTLSEHNQKLRDDEIDVLSFQMSGLYTNWVDSYFNSNSQDSYFRNMGNESGMIKNIIVSQVSSLINKGFEDIKNSQKSKRIDQATRIAIGSLVISVISLAVAIFK